MAIAGYQWFINGAFAKESVEPFIDLTDLAPDTDYTCECAAFDGAGNVSEKSAPLVVRTLPGADVTPPTQSTNPMEYE